MSDTSDLVKIAFPLNPDESGGISVERLWAQPLSDGTYVLDNSPFHAYGVSWQDVVSAELDETGELVYSAIARRGGHSTYRVRLPKGKSDAYFLEIWPRLEAQGCTYEGTGDELRLYAIDIPPGTSVSHVYQILADLETAEILEFEEGHYARP